MKIFILLSCLHIVDVFARESIFCEIPAVESMGATSLTCTFPYDLTVTRKDFAVHYLKSTRKPVLDCLWIEGDLQCFEVPGFVFNRTVSSQLTVLIPHAFPNMTGEYYCKVSDSTGLEIRQCQLVLIPDSHSHTNKTTDTNNEKNNTLVIGLSSAFVFVAVIVAVIVVFFRKRFRFRRNREQGHQEEEHLMGTSNDEKTKVKSQISEKQKKETMDFQKYLEDSVKKMYPNISRGCYFVPPIYFNKTGYNKEDFHDQGVYVPVPYKLSDKRHDGAMQHVMHCLQSFAHHGEEQMFVLTQFQYEDYLNNPGDKFARHCLPVPAALPVSSDDKGKIVSCFDFLIVHRQNGILVGVVNAVGAQDEESKHNEQTEEKRVVDEINEAVQQLSKADRMLRHLMSDQEPFPKVRQTLILPNITRATLQRALAPSSHKDVVDKLRQRLDVTTLDDPTKKCLCSENLSKHNEPWNVSKHVVQNLQNILMWTTRNKDGEINITEDVYLSIIARFVGPATQSALQAPDNCERFLLPKTLCEAVSLTGDLFGRTILHQDLIMRLNTESTGFLVGPPNTGKTRILTLVGGKCLFNGQNVFVVKDKSSPNDSFLLHHLKKLAQQQSIQPQSGRAYGSIYEEKIDLNKKESVKEFVKKVAAKKGEKAKCVLLDIGHLKGKHANTFCQALLKKCSDVQLLVSCTGDSSPAILPFSKHFTEIINCPPSVVREVATTKGYRNNWEEPENENLTLPPTDGPPVKIIYYLWSVRNHPHDSVQCGQDVGSFLTNELLITGTDESTSQSVCTSDLQCKDVLIVFEKDCVIAEDCNFLRGLRQSGITVHAAVNNDNNSVDGGVNSAWAMSVPYMDTYRVKRKVVVYVEYYKLFATDQENKNRALTSCTSQLILVKPLLAFFSVLATETPT